MFCVNCGKEISNDAKFCPSCGEQIGNSQNVSQDQYVKEDINIDKNKLLFQVTPTFLWSKYFFDSIISLIILLLVIGTSIIGAVYSTGFGGKVFSIVILVLFVIALIYIGVGYLKKVQFEHLIYKFYPDRLEYEDGFLNKAKKRIKYSNVREINLRRTVTERIFKLGAIVISTSAEGGYSGISISNLRDSEEIYEKIQEIINY